MQRRRFQLSNSFGSINRQMFGTLSLWPWRRSKGNEVGPFQSRVCSLQTGSLEVSFSSSKEVFAVRTVALLVFALMGTAHVAKPQAKVRYLSDMPEHDVKVYRAFGKKGELGYFAHSRGLESPS